jgi:hypothetical protein
MPQVAISLDVDTLHHYAFLAPGGHVGDDHVLSHTVPRLLDVLDSLGIKATLFAIGESIARDESLWRRAADAGHELASHSLSHFQDFHARPPETKRRELADSKRRIEDCVGHPVVGFRAPAYNIDAHGLCLVASAGYKYDSSFFPGWYVPLGKAVLRLKSTQPRAAAMSSLYWRHWRLPRSPFHWSTECGQVLELPLATGSLACPFMGTIHLNTPRWFFEKQLRYLARRPAPVVYELHPTEVLDGKSLEDNPWLLRIPGVGRKRDPWHFLEFRLRRLQSLGETVLMRDIHPRNAPVISARL